MKKLHIGGMLIAAMLVITFSCKKTNLGAPVDPGAQQVVINDKTYATVKIGTQTWTAVNYAGPGGVAYDNANSKPAYGKYYTRAEMKAIVAPSGWRIPTMDDFRLLSATAGIVFNVNSNNTEAIKKLTASAGWLHIQGSNTLGFNAQPAGYIANGASPEGGDNAEFWTSDDHTFSLMEGGDQQRMNVQFYSYSLVETDRFNIRFVKN